MHSDMMYVFSMAQIQFHSHQCVDDDAEFKLGYIDDYINNICSTVPLISIPNPRYFPESCFCSPCCYLVLFVLCSVVMVNVFPFPFLSFFSAKAHAHFPFGTVPLSKLFHLVPACVVCRKISKEDKIQGEHVLKR